MSAAGRALVVVLLGSLVLAGPACGVPTESGDRPLREDDVPLALLADTTTTTTTTTVPPAVTVETFPIDVWFVRGDRLLPVRRDQRRRPDLDDLLEALVDGPAPDERRAGLRSALPDTVEFSGEEPVGGEIVIDLDPSFRNLSGPEQVLALAQLVYTATGLPGAGRVTFTIAGVPLDVPRADGLLVSGSVSRDDYTPLVEPTPVPEGSVDAVVPPPAEVPEATPLDPDTPPAEPAPPAQAPPPDPGG